jgi:hypothetical protein
MECNTESCCTSHEESCACGSDKPYEQCCGNEPTDPAQHGIIMGHKAFFAALEQAQTDRLRKKIEAGFDQVLDKEADAVFEAIGKIWSSTVMQSDAKKELVTKLQKIYADANRK